MGVSGLGGFGGVVSLSSFVSFVNVGDPFVGFYRAVVSLTEAWLVFRWKRITAPSSISRGWSNKSLP